MTFDGLVGLPWEERGRGPDGWDCWGLYGRMLAVKGIVLPSYAEGYSGIADKDGIAALIDGHRTDWIRIEPGQERPFDGVLFGGSSWHIGGVTERGFMLHMPRGGTSVIERYDGTKFAARLRAHGAGFYRHPNLV